MQRKRIAHFLNEAERVGLRAVVVGFPPALLEVFRVFHVAEAGAMGIHLNHSVCSTIVNNFFIPLRPTTFATGDEDVRHDL